MAKTLKPIFGRVLVRADAMEDTVHRKYKSLAEAGFKIPDTAKEKDVPDEGTVIAVGKTAEHIQEGDRVLWGKWAAKRVPWEDHLYVMADEDIIGIITEDKKIVDLKEVKNG